MNLKFELHIFQRAVDSMLVFTEDNVAVCYGSRQYETVVPLEDSIVTEVTATLQEWASLWKQLYVVSKC